MAEAEIEQQAIADPLEVQLRDSQAAKTVQGIPGAPGFWEPAYSISA